MTEKLPEHVAIIMDGNGRWAKKRNLPRIEGHREGVKRIEETIQMASDRGIKVLTLYTFSTENWRRPKDEVSMIMKTLCSVLNHKIRKLQKGNIRLHSVGRRDGVPKEVLNSIDNGVELTKKNTGMILNLAVNYGSRMEMLDAVRDIARAVKEGRIDIEKIDEEVFSQALYTKDLPDPDFLIRTSGEMRLSNFLLWQLSYAEFYFTDKFWPEFTNKEFEKAILEYQDRDRRYGKVSSVKK